MKRFIVVFLLFVFLFLLPTVSRADAYNNLSTCLQGFGYGCRHDLLTQEEAGRVKQAEAGKSTARNNYQKPTLSPSVITPSVNTGGRNYSPPSYSLQQQPTYAVPCAENGSCYGDISSITGIPKTVSVQGYFRRDGTYVRGHYRSHR